MLRYQEDGDPILKKWVEQFMEKKSCSECSGFRLKKEALHFRIADKHIGELSAMDLDDLASWLTKVPNSLSNELKPVAEEILKEINTRLQFILEVGLGYLSLGRSSKSLSGGEAQRIRLATQIGTELMNVMYILDEPSIGLHQRDNNKLIQSLKKLRDRGNSVIVVEHDREMIVEADHILDIGPGAGVNGGNIVFSGSREELLKCDTITAQYLKGSRQIEISNHKRTGNGKFLTLKSASGNTLKNIDLKIPLGTLTCVTGVSGSGKSTVINQTLYPALRKHFYQSAAQALPYDSIEIGRAHV